MKAERNTASNTLRGTLLLRMANSRTLAKHRVHHPEGSLPSSRKNSFAKRYFGCQKTKGAGLEASEGSNPLLQFSRFFLEIGSGRPLPLNHCFKNWLSTVDATV